MDFDLLFANNILIRCTVCLLIIACFFFRLEFQALIDKTKVNPNEVGDIVVGTVLAPGSMRAIKCRIAAFYAGFPGNFCYFLHNNISRAQFDILS